MANEINKTATDCFENKKRTLFHKIEAAWLEHRCLEAENARLEAENARLEVENARMDDAIDEYKELLSIIEKGEYDDELPEGGVKL